MQLNIRPAGVEDIDAIVKLAHAIWWSHYPGILTDDQIRYMLAWMYSPGQIRQELTQGIRWELLELSAGDQPHAAGFAAYGPLGGATCKLHKLYLLAEHHGKGLGRQMLHHVIATAQAAGAHAVVLNVNKQNTKAIRAYERAGFVIKEAVCADIGGGYVMDDFVMERKI